MVCFVSFLRRAAAVALGVSAVFASGGAWADYWVSPAGADSNSGSQDSPFRSIQQAVDSAPDAGCVIHLAEGYYNVKAGTTPNQMLLVDKPVKIIADGAREKTVLDAEAKRRAVWVNCEGALIAGVVITRGAFYGWNQYGGVKVTAGVVSNCVIEANGSYHNDGALVDGGTLTHCIVRNNITGTNPNGMGVTITKGLVEHCDIYGHTRDSATSAAGCGLYVNGGEVRHCSIHDNHLGAPGRAADRLGASVSNGGGGVWINNGRVSDCTVYGNSIIGYGSGVRLSGGVFENSLVYGNAATNFYSTSNTSLVLASGAVYVSGGTMSNCTVTANSALLKCGGVEQTGGKVVDCVVFGNGACDYIYTKGTMTNVITNNPGFVDAIAGDYTIPAADAFSCNFTQDVRVVRGDAGGKVKFYATTANLPGAATYSWTFGDGASGTGETVEHTYAPGIWSVRLTVTAGGQTATCSAKDCVMVFPETVSVYKDEVPDEATGVTTTDIYAALDLHPQTIELHEGTYDVSKCPVWLCEPVTLRGVGERDQVILDAGTASYTRVLVVGHAEAKVEGVKIYRGNTGDTWTSGGGAVIYAGQVSNCWFHANKSYYAPAFVVDTGASVVDSLVTGYSEGGGDSCAAACAVNGGLMAGCTVTAGTGASVAGSMVRGTVYVLGATAVVTNCLIYGNNLGGAAKNNLGGGVYMTGGLIVGCVITNNTSAKTGGGVNMTGGTLRNCLVADNRINNAGGSTGGGIYQSGGSIENCTVVKNVSTTTGGGLYQTAGSAVNSVFYYNEGGNVSAAGSVTYCGASPLVSGEGNTAAEPAFLDAEAGDWRFTSLARDYIDKATSLAWMSGATDIAGKGRVNGTAADIGAYEYYPSADEPFIASFSTEVLSGGSPLDCTFTATITKYAIADCTFEWDFGDGSETVTENGKATVDHQYVKAGAFTVTLTVYPPSGSADEPAVMPRTGYVTVIPEVCYVSPNGSNTYPYESWEKAANNLPEAVAVGSAKVVVTNGTYSFKSIVLSRPISVVSVEGPEVTILKSSENGYNLMTLKDASARLGGFTLRDSNIGDWLETTGGSGLRIEAGVASNCIVRNCHKYSYGNTYVCGTGRLLDSKLINNSSGAVDATASGLYVAEDGYVSGCAISNNTMICSANWGGAGLSMSGGTVTNCVFANNRQTKDGGRCGGANIRGGLVTHCVFSNNSAIGYVGGVQVSHGTIRNSLIVGNSCSGAGAGNGVGGLYLLEDGVAESLTVADNVASLPGSGVRQSGGTLVNTVVYGNTSGAELDITGGTQSHCLSSMAFPAGAEDCLVGDPQFVGNGSYVLSPISPAKNAGANQGWMEGAKDLAGLARVQGDAVEIGAYEIDASIVVPFTAKIEVTSSEKLASGKSRITLTAVYGGNEGAVTFCWKFGDVAEEAWTETDEAVITHEYVPGSFTVTMKAYDDGKQEWTDELTATAVAMPETCYVAQGENVTPVFPYMTPETGAASLKDALTVDCSEIIVCPGTYQISEVVNVAKAVTIRGQASDREAATIYAPEVNGLRVMNINHADALVCGLTLSGGAMLEGYSGGAVLNLTAGTVSNCVMNGGYNYYGSSVFVKNGKIVDSVIRNAVAGHSDQEASGVTIYEGGLVDRCVITNNNTVSTASGARGEAVCLDGSTAVIRNSLIARNKGRNCAGLRVLSAQELVGCTIVSNVASLACGGVKTDAGSCRPGTCANNIIWGNVAPTNPNVDTTIAYIYCCAPELTEGSGNITADPKFRNPAKGDWRLRVSSPCVNAGYKAFVPAGSRDVLGKPRIAGGTPDIGCFENPCSGLSLIVR